ncbi:unnamed protein product [Paramecium primaurelia]|uniref:Transmembrane protein n=1 Tax=Paramecium primaurelia TaxID=5886 RepID=A0A8S1MZT4_PARPR|nr:unnamed protein product [Paramecium primaurelia]
MHNLYISLFLTFILFGEGQKIQFSQQFKRTTTLKGIYDLTNIKIFFYSLQNRNQQFELIKKDDLQEIQRQILEDFDDYLKNMKIQQFQNSGKFSSILGLEPINQSQRKQELKSYLYQQFLRDYQYYRKRKVGLARRIVFEEYNVKKMFGLGLIYIQASSQVSLIYFQWIYKYDNKKEVYIHGQIIKAIIITLKYNQFQFINSDFKRSIIKKINIIYGLNKITRIIQYQDINKDINSEQQNILQDEKQFKHNFIN